MGARGLLPEGPAAPPTPEPEAVHGELLLRTMVLPLSLKLLLNVLLRQLTAEAREDAAATPTRRVDLHSPTTCCPTILMPRPGFPRRTRRNSWEAKEEKANNPNTEEREVSGRGWRRGSGAGQKKRTKVD